MLRAPFLNLLVCSVVATALPATQADAQSKSTAIAKPKSALALDHLAKGNKLYNVRSFEEAAQEYKAGALVEAAPIFDYNLGQCYRQLGKYEDAIWHYRRFIKDSPGATTNVEAASTFITQMQDELNKKAMSAPPTEAAPTTSSPETPEPKPSDRVVADPLLVENAPWYHDRLGLGLTVLGVVATGVATGLLISASSLNDDANASTSQQERDDLFDKAETRSTLGIGTMIGGGAILVTGIVMLSIPDKRSPQARVSVGFRPNGITIQGSF
jgi:tetratricopeptide (TPR) repeat protein